MVKRLPLVMKRLRAHASTAGGACSLSSQGNQFPTCLPCCAALKKKVKKVNFILCVFTTAKKIFDGRQLNYNLIRKEEIQETRN